MKIKRLVPVFLITILYILFFTNAKYIKESIVNSMIFCGKVLIPSVFPFILLSCFVVNSGLLDYLLSEKKIHALNKLGICKIYASSVISGSLSGYVSGAKCICSIAEKDTHSKNEFSNAVILSSNAGIGFVVSCVGIIIWESIAFGIYLYCIQIFTAIILGALLLPDTKASIDYMTKKQRGYIEAFTESVIGALSSVLTISAFVTAFSLICDLLAIFLPSPLSLSIYCITEFCKGAFKCAELSNIILKAFFTGFTVGFGGICVHFQIFSVCRKFPLNKGLFCVFKLIQGILVGLASAMYVGLTKVGIKSLIFIPLFLTVLIISNIIFKKN